MVKRLALYPAQNSGGALTGRLADRVAVVTGAAQGIGHAVSQAFAQEGAHVMMVDKSPAVAKAAAGIAESGLRATALECDVTDRESVQRRAETVRDEIGLVTILVNNAGITRPGMLWKLSDDDWDAVLNVHLKGSFNWLRAVVPQMQSAGWGRVISTVSSAGINGTIGQAN